MERQKAKIKTLHETVGYLDLRGYVTEVWERCTDSKCNCQNPRSKMFRAIKSALAQKKRQQTLFVLTCQSVYGF